MERLKEFKEKFDKDIGFNGFHGALSHKFILGCSLIFYPSFFDMMWRGKRRWFYMYLTPIIPSIISAYMCLFVGSQIHRITRRFRM